MQIALTDDEIVAICHAVQGTWTRQLPTVQVGDTTELARAAVRGYRSLEVRGLMEPGNPGEEMLGKVMALVGQRPHVTVHPVDETVTTVEPWEELSIFGEVFIEADAQPSERSAAESSVVVFTNATGVNLFTTSTPTEVKDLLVETCEKAGSGTRLALLCHRQQCSVRSGLLVSETVHTLKVSQGSPVLIEEPRIRPNSSDEWHCMLSGLR